MKFELPIPNHKAFLSPRIHVATLVLLLIIGVSVCVVPCLAGSVASPALSAPTVGSSPVHVSVGDFNGDGIPDLAVANSGSNTISILLGKGDGTFQPAVNYPVGPQPVSIVVGDFNKDGKADLAVALHGSNVVGVLLGNGDGTFPSLSYFSVTTSATSIATGDFNGDGKLDLVVTNDSTGLVTLLLGNGDGTFQGPTTSTVGSNPAFLAVGDFNNDGKLDIAVANEGSGTISILLGKGDGTFQSATSVTTDSGPDGIVVADFNRDGKPDLGVVNSLGADVTVFLGNGDGTFQTAKIFYVQSTPTSIATADLNGDGFLDFVVTNAGSDTISILFGAGDGNFGAPFNYVVGSEPVSVAIADFNADSLLDLAVVSNNSSALTILLGLPGAFFPAPSNYSALATPGLDVSVVSADFNGDGNLDLLAYSPTHTSTNTSLLLGNGDGTFKSSSTVNVGVAPAFLIAADFNGDGKADIAVGNTTSVNVSVLLGNGDGTFQTAVTYSAISIINAIVGGDFNGDGIQDICVVTLNGTSVLLGKGDGTFQSAITTAVPFQTGQKKLVAVADVNGDGIPDLVVSEPTNSSVFVLLGNGDGTFRLASKTSTIATPASLAVGDMNGDGKADLVIGIQSISGVFSIMAGNGDGTFQSPVFYQPTDFPGSISAVAVGDFNGDGISDVALTNNLLNKILILTGKGDGSFQTALEEDSGAIPDSILATDLNGDGKIDWAVGTRGGVSVVLNTLSTAPGPTSVNLQIPQGGASSSIVTSSSRDIQTGYASVTVSSGDAPYGTAVFSLKQNGVTVSETAVPASPPTTAARVFVEYRTGVAAKSMQNDAGAISVYTGIAIVNDGSGTAHLTGQLFDKSGNLVAQGHGTLQAGEHFSGYLGDLGQIMPDFVVPDTFPTSIQYGSLVVQGDQAFSILALRLTTNQRGETLISSTPTADLTQTLSGNAIFLPRIVDGGGWQSGLYLMNTSTGTETGTLQILAHNGSPLSVQMAGGASGSSFPYSIPPNGVFELRTSDILAATIEGWVEVIPDASNFAPMAGGIFGFTQNGILVTEAGIPSAARTTHARIYLDLSNGHNTGLALGNPNSSIMNVNLQAFNMDGVTPAGNANTLAVNASGETANFVNQWITGLPSAFKGILDISSSSPFVPLSLRTFNNERNEFLITTFPVADLTRLAPSPIIFPQIASGGGYQTEFILLSAGGPVSTTLNYFDNNGSPLSPGATKK